MNLLAHFMRIFVALFIPTLDLQEPFLVALHITSLMLIPSNMWRQIKIKGSPDEQPFKRVWELVHLNTVITKRGVYFLARVKTGQPGTWSLVEKVLVQNPFSGIWEMAYYVGVHLWLDWPPLARGFQISHTHPPRPLVLPPIEQWKIWTSRFRCNNINYSSRQLRFPM